MKTESNKQSALTPPTPIKRERRLTLPLDETHDSTPSTSCRWFRSRPKPQLTHAQSTSLLFTKLPPELRSQIYTFAICAHERSPILIGFHGSPIASMNTSNKPGYIAAYRDTSPGTRVWGLDRGVLSLMRSCRRVYTEAIPLLYSMPTFVFEHTGPLTFLAFVGGMVEGRKGVVRWVDLTGLECMRPGESGEKQGEEEGDREFSYAFVRHLDMYTELPDAMREGRKLTEGWAVGKVLGEMEGLGRGGVVGWVESGDEGEERRVVTRQNGV